MVEDAADSDGLLLKITNIPDDFLWIFKDFASVDNMKPLRINKDAKTYPNNLVESINDFKGKNLRIYFDGKLKGIQAEMSNPMECNQVYCIEILDR